MVNFSIHWGWLSLIIGYIIFTLYAYREDHPIEIVPYIWMGITALSVVLGVVGGLIYLIYSLVV